jgi:dsDNA-specific endonuclease/ATPase MutS2
MKLKPGDKVKFKNESGEGVIVKILSDDEVEVLVEDIEIRYKIDALIHVTDEGEIYTKVNEDKVKEKVTKGRNLKPVPGGVLEKHRINSERSGSLMIEIDLHIEELVKYPERLEPYQKLQKQLQCVKDCIEAARHKKISTLIFIHGKGTGVLRTELINYLSSLAEDGITFCDADFNRYGGGAVKVTIRGLHS